MSEQRRTAAFAELRDRPIGSYHVRRGGSAAGAYELVITPEDAGWGYSGLRILELEPGGVHRFESADDEMIVLPLRGGGSVECDGTRWTLSGRASVFAGVSDFVYVCRVTAAWSWRQTQAAASLFPAPARSTGSNPVTWRAIRCRSSCAVPGRPAGR